MDPVETLSVPGTPPGVRQAVDAFERFGQRVHVPRPARWRIQLALDEILSNIVRHGAAPGAGDPAIDVTFSFKEGVVDVEVLDTGSAFNPLLVPPPDRTSPLAVRPEGGLGLALVRFLVDEASYDRRGNRNHFVMRVSSAW